MSSITQPLLNGDDSSSGGKQQATKDDGADDDAVMMARKKNTHHGSKHGESGPQFACIAERYRGEQPAQHPLAGQDFESDAQARVAIGDVFQHPIDAFKAAAKAARPEFAHNEMSGGFADDNPKLKHVVERSTASHNARLRARRNTIARNATALALEVVFVTAAAAVWFADSRDGTLIKLFDVPLHAWLLVLAAFIPSAYAATALEWLSRSALQLILCRAYDNAGYVLVSLRKGCWMLFTALAMQAATLWLTSYKDAGMVEQTVTKLTLCAVIASAVELIKDLSARLLSLRVNSEGLFDAIEECIREEEILHRVMSSAGTRELRAKAPAIASARSIPEEKVSSYLQDVFRLSLPTDHSGNRSFVWKMMKMIHRYDDMAESELDTHAAHAAEYFWWAVREDTDRQRVTRADIEATLDGDQQAADFAFSLFDLDNDGFVVEHEVQSRFQKVYRSRRSLALTLTNTEDVLTTVSALLGCILHAGAFFAYLALFGVDVHRFMIALSSGGLAFTFVFGNNLQQIYESVVFLFVVRPYKVGDWLLYQHGWHKVLSFGLLTTQLQCSTGMLSTVPNATLKESNIANITDSGFFVQCMTLEVDASDAEVDSDQTFVSALSEVARDAVSAKENKYLFDQDYHIAADIESVTAPSTYTIELSFRMAHSLEEYTRVRLAREVMTGAVSKWCKAHNVSRSISFQQGFLHSDASKVKA